MAKNAEALAKIGIAGAMVNLQRAIAPKPQPPPDSDEPQPERRPARPKRERGEVAPQRRSTRVAGAIASQRLADGGDGADAPDDGPGAKPGRGVGVMSQEEYLASKGQSLPEGWFKSDGHFKGWVAPDVCEKLGLASSAAEAWEQGGGGKFQRKISKSDVPSILKAKGWSDARAFAASQMRKNPNAYFYRHTAPGQPQAQGEWTAEEHDLFVATARKYGVGDKWGLFASYIPNRVGYQCSAYYTQVIIPTGLILDARFRMDAWGDAVFVGNRGKDD
ncbi:hypothetical protein HYH02_014802 [Chlamydomonas schloesseri]|uniref:Myb-like domain-containing protein n=1 Tax=Chlamydomonas schloesseri TaxID=2026947 RepID=A0A835VUV7_9CHLO|nr:hypothetical protein HYH02_014802 [Chlamydomonas schloesseri]|eukprot:KAG2426374.1 hypothetical protein HYH02_014802 [Chlamydomonas schloesseri]